MHVYPSLLTFADAYPCLPIFTRVYPYLPCLPMFTHIYHVYPSSLMFTHVYSCLPSLLMFIHVYPYLRIFTSIVAIETKHLIVGLTLDQGR